MAHVGEYGWDSATVPLSSLVQTSQSSAVLLRPYLSPFFFVCLLAF